MSKWFTPFVMLDIEMLTKNVLKPCVVEVGICVRDVFGAFSTHNAAVKPDLEKIDMDTLNWWSKQQYFAKLIEECTTAESSVQEVMQAWRAFHKPANLPVDVTWWAQGPQFDMIAMQATPEFGAPWMYNKVRDLRTASNVFGNPELPFKNDCAHNAGADAEYQARKLAWLEQHHGLVIQ